MKYRVFALDEKMGASGRRYRLYIPSTRADKSWERARFEDARFATPEEAAEAIEKDATYPGDCIIVACVD